MQIYYNCIWYWEKFDLEMMKDKKKRIEGDLNLINHSQNWETNDINIIYWYRHFLNLISHFQNSKTNDINGVYW
jgi:hypothetical protein